MFMFIRICIASPVGYNMFLACTELQSSVKERFQEMVLRFPSTSADYFCIRKYLYTLDLKVFFSCTRGMKE